MGQSSKKSSFPYNRLVLVGNGFDLAMGLKTSYKDFVLAYHKQELIKVVKKQLDEKGMVVFSNPYGHYHKFLEGEINSLKEFDKLIELSQNYFPRSYPSTFFMSIVARLIDANWVDIENEYFKQLVSLHSRINKAKSSTTIKGAFSDLKKLNEGLSQVTKALDAYIQKEQSRFNFEPRTGPAYLFLQEIYRPIASILEDRSHRISNRKPDSVLFINFNYSDALIKQLMPWDADFVQHIHIHGEAGNFYHPIIFGYGDDTGEQYQNLEKTGEDEFLIKIKAFQYPNTNHYHRVLDFLEAQKFDVFIVGHSCGLSDRTLLKTIFEHDNCIAIKNFHYREPEKEAREEDFYKRIAISRHFEDKVKMRDRLLPFDPEARMPQA